ncbi:hypothetical protein L207DRAFT_638239 [Hyaloscypha variabilis F]|uniref:Uncharacterized protein n=1 Tax=Hyaloscypha variabilis (strain UAMH 11265 / GT02V1 / F) TaxID=1149755 RepID=A0A2J6R870_HYAVF|nr:hypothetical protein L207DRAFT_638239 [Hyaloscypha variabilis F]
MLLTFIAPEFLLAKSFTDRRAVGSSRRKLQELAAEDGVQWTRVHSSFANMGGFVIRICNTTSDPRPSPRLARSRLYHLVASDVLALRANGILEKLPPITEEEINDKSKSDGLVRAIVVVQIMWMMVQIAVRTSRHLAISELEVSVLAFASCAIMIYLLNWDRPKGVQIPCTLITYQGEIPESVLGHIAARHPASTIEIILELAEMVGVAAKDKTQPGDPIHKHVSYFESHSSRVSDVLSLLLGGAIFGAIHIAAWNFVFPTPIERTLWRVSSIVSTVPVLVYLAYGILLLSLVCCFDLENDNALLWLRIVTGISSIPLCVAYVVARLFIIVEIFRTFLFLPPSAYIATWASNVPHIA